MQKMYADNVKKTEPIKPSDELETKEDTFTDRLKTSAEKKLPVRKTQPTVIPRPIVAVVASVHSGKGNL